MINYAEREQSEEDGTAAAQQPFEQPDDGRNWLGQHPVLNAMLSNVVQDLQTSLSDIRNIRASNMTGSTTGTLSNFSERLESVTVSPIFIHIIGLFRMDNIIANSDTLLRNIRSTFGYLPSGSAENARSTTENEPRWNFNDPGFYVRDLRTEVRHYLY